MDYKQHIAENIAKGSSLCPFGSAQMGQALSAMDKTKDVQSSSSLPEDFDLLGYGNGDQADTDDEPLTDIEM